MSLCFYGKTQKACLSTCVYLKQNNLTVPWAESHVEAAHLAEVYGIPVRVEKRESGVGRASNEHACDPVATTRSRVKYLTRNKAK